MKSARRPIIVLANTTAEHLLPSVCRTLRARRGKMQIERFSDGEICVRFFETLRDTEVVILGGTQPPAENFLELALLASAAHECGAREITMVVTYLGYNRQDKSATGFPAARLPIKLLAHSGAKRILVVDPHVLATLAHATPLSARAIAGAPAGAAHLKRRKRQLVVVSPDAGGRERARKMARLLGAPIPIVLHKQRNAQRRASIDASHARSALAGHDVLLVDDVIDTGGTLAAAADAVRAVCARHIIAFATHGLFSGDALKRLGRSSLDEILVTDTLPPITSRIKGSKARLHIIPIAPLLASALRGVITRPTKRE